MASLKRKFSWRLVALVLALVALIGATWMWRRFLAAEPSWKRIPIPSSELKTAEGFSVCWHLPERVRNLRWRRTGVCVRENGRPLPLREADIEPVAKQGNGRFFVWTETLWLSATDNGNPSTNGKRYELAVEEPEYRLAVGAGILLVLATTLGLLAVPERFWRNAIADLGAPGEGRRRQLRRFEVLMLGAAGFCLTQAWTPAQIVRQHILLPATFSHTTGAEFSYAVPRWLKHQGRMETAVLFEDQTPLKRVKPWALEPEKNAGYYDYASDAIRLRTSDGSNPALNGRSYKLKVAVFPREESLRLAMLLGLTALVLFFYSPALAAARVSPRSFQAPDWRLVLLAVAAAKFWIVAGDEVVAAEADATSYANGAISLAFGGGSHPAGFPIIAGLFRGFGVPWRLALEGLYLGACAWIAGVMVLLFRSRLAATMMFIGMVWHPWTLRGFHEFMAYPMVTVLSVALLAVMFRLLSQGSADWKWRSFALTGTLLFFWEWSRVEDPLVYGSYALFAGLAWMLARRETNPAPWRERIGMLALPVVMVFLFSTGVKLVNYSNSGVYTKCLIDSPGLLALMKALYRVKSEQALRYAPVTRQSLQAACRASPSLGPFEKNLLDPTSISARFGELFTRQPGEFGPWLGWLLPQSLPADTPEANAVMLHAADEINSALREGRLPSRPAFFPLDPNWRLWLPDLLPCCLKSFSYAASFQGYPNSSAESGTVQDRLFDLAANRRAAGTRSVVLLGEISLQSPPASIDTVAVSDKRGVLIGISAVSSNMWEHKEQCYLQADLPKDTGDYGLEFFTSGRLRYSDRGHDLLPWTNNVVLPDSGEKLIYNSRFQLSQSVNARRLEVWEGKAPVVYKALLWAGLLAAWVAVFLGRRQEPVPLARMLACLLLGCGWLGGRAGLYGLIEADVGWGADRYMPCVSPLFVMLLFMAAAIAAAWIRRKMGLEVSHSEAEGAD